MQRLTLPGIEHDSLSLRFRLQHVVIGAFRRLKPELVQLVHVNHWFGPRWLHFAGTDRRGRDLRARERLILPPFASGRILSERTYNSDGGELRRGRPRLTLHRPGVRELDQIADTGLYVWFSGDTLAQDRGALMVYEIRGAGQRGWYAEFRRQGGVWTISATVGISKDELEALEASHTGVLASLAYDPEADDSDRGSALLRRVEEAMDAGQHGLARVLVGRLRARRPRSRRALYIEIELLTGMRSFARADELLREMPVPNTPRERVRQCMLGRSLARCRGRLAAEEHWCREFLAAAPEGTVAWIFLGSCLARQGRLEEALAAHREATVRDGNPDEAWLNIGLILRGMARYEEAAQACREALALSPHYPAATRLLVDVEAALAALNELD